VAKLSDKRERLLELQRPHCPECDMRMMATQPGAETFKCLRCGYLGPPVE
jgi:tRNA(Ile2) C34 agmatinyltransferase TiaS